MTLSKEWTVLAEHLQEASGALSHSDIHSHLSKALGDSGYVHDVNGDDKSGHVVYSKFGANSMKRAPYKIRTGNGTSKATIDHDNAEDVTPRTVFDPPITDAKDAKEVELVGDVINLKEGAVGQDGTAYLKLIAPGWGSSGYYSKEVLKRDGPQIFKAGTKNFWNHQTEAEESARPEGDLRDLASTLTEDAHYEDPGTAGPGLYAKANVQPHFKEHVDSLAKHIGMSIRASGIAKPGTAEGRKGNIIEQLTRGISVDYVTTPGAGGKVLQLFEAARGARTTTGENDMDKAEIQALFKESLDAALAPMKAENQRLRETIELQQAPKLIAETLNDIRLPDASKRKILEKLTSPNVLPMLPMKEGKLDKPELDKLIETEAKREAAFLMELGYGSGIAAVGARMTEAELQTAGADQEKQHATNFAESMDRITDIFVGPKLGKGTVDDVARQARKVAREAFQKGRAA